ncbi:MAG: allantoate deiminase [Bacillota bacterium]|nr:allantoate deiminase [Bacillota bacterium]
MEAKVERLQRDIEALAQFTATPGAGVTRFSFTPEDRAAREYIKAEMARAGLTVREDAAGTVIGRREGEVPGPVVMVGSHFDSVKHGGPFDGTAGVVAALEIARVLQEHNVKTRYPIEFIAMIEEEGGRFGGGLFGSRAMAGKVSREELLRNKDAQGISTAEAMAAFGFPPENIKAAERRPEDLKAFFELHIEQGPVLEAAGIDVGVVETIVGIVEYEVEIGGRPDHAGTTPMTMRADALVAASRVVQAVERLAREAGGGAVGTVGRLEVAPGAANIVPGRVRFTVDFRAKDGRTLADLVAGLKTALHEACQGELTFTLTEKLSVPPVVLPEAIRALLVREAEARGISTKVMLSGAGHDAMVMAGLTDVGLIFVPSRGGRSHCPEEWTDYAALKKGVDVLLGTILQIAEG